MCEYYFSPSRFCVTTLPLKANIGLGGISGVCVYTGGADTLVRRSRITYQHLIAYSLSNISTKDYQKSVDVR